MWRSISYFILFITGISPLFLSAQSGPPWVKTNVGYNFIFRAIDFPSNQDNIGFLGGESLTYSGDGLVLKTIDGGVTWTPVWSGADMGVEGASFPDLNTGYIAGWPNNAQGWYGAGKTTNGGTTWTSMNVTGNLYFFTDIVFKDVNNGIVVGQTNSGGGVWWTSNGGTTWTPSSGVAAIPQHACHISGNVYFLVDNNGNIQKSVNNGQSWTTVHSIPGLYILGIDHFGDNTIMTCGDYGVICKSYDGGNTWEDMTVGVDIWHDFAWEFQDNVFVCGTPELVFESTDGGVTWDNSFPGSSQQAALYEAVFTPNGKGFICGSQGTLLKRAPSCAAGFTASSTSTCTGKTVVFTNTSYGNNLTFSWLFEGGTPAVSSDQNPVVTYNSTGIFDVKLTVSNGNWTDSLRKADYITVTQSPAAPVVTLNGYTLNSSVASGNQWYLNGFPVPGATGQTHEVTVSGMYWDVVTVNNCPSDTSNNIYVVMTGMDDPGLNSLKILPNPNQGRFTITWTGSEDMVSVDVYSIQGVRVYRESFQSQIGPNSRMMDIRDHSAGLYLLEFRCGDTSQKRKLLISNAEIIR